MTTPFQSGQHPDADQLNAFVEHALPPHEQQATLAHLATCVDCRAIVFLVQPAVLEEAAHPVGARRPWFSSWMLALPAAAAFACLVLLTIHLRDIRFEKNQAAAVQTARLEQTPPPLTAAPSAAPAPPPKPALAQERKLKTVPPQRALAPTTPANPAKLAQGRTSNVSAEAPLAVTGSPSSYHGTTLPAAPKQQVVAAAASGANFMSATPAAVPPAAPLSPNTAPPPSAGLYGGGSARLQLHSAASQYNSAAAAAQQAPPSTASANTGIYGGTGETNLNETYVEGVPAPNASAQTASAAAQTVTVTNASAMVDTVDAATLQTKVLPKLPSKLPALSIVSNAHRQLAIDTAGALFRSEDAGVTWQPVPVQWTGRAVKIALNPPPNARLFAKNAGALATPPAGAKPAATPPAQPAIFELTTDSGGLWISADGKSWKQKE